MKLVFLDIDGVANSSRSVIVKMGPTLQTSELVRQLAMLDHADFYDSTDKQPSEDGLDYSVRFGLQCADPVCVALINKLFEADSSIGLVLSSTHRKFLHHSKVSYGSQEHLGRLRLYLTAMGFQVPTFFSVTRNSHHRRGAEIDAWICQAWENGLYDDGDEYVIIDDSADMLPGQSFVRVDAEHGFSFANYAEACKMLGLKEPGMVLL